MADVLSNQLKAVFAFGNFTDNIVLYRPACSTICQFHYACKRNRNAVGKQVGVTDTTLMTIDLKSVSADKYKELYKALKNAQISSFSVLFNAVFDNNKQLTDYYGGMVVDGYVVDVAENFDATAICPNGMSLRIQILVNTLQYIGKQNTKQLQLNLA